MLNKDLQEIEKINKILNENDKKLKNIVESIESEYKIFQETKTYLVKEKKMTYTEFRESLEFKTITKKIRKLEIKEKILNKFNKILENNKYIIIEKILLNLVLKMDVLQKLNNKKIGEKRSKEIKDNFKNGIEPFLKDFDIQKNIYLHLDFSNWDYIDFKTSNYSYCTLNINIKDNYLNLNNLSLLIQNKIEELKKIYIPNPYRYILNSFKNEKLLKELEKEKELIEEQIYSLKKEIILY